MKILSLFLALCLSARGAITVDAYIDFEGGTGAITPAELETDTHDTAGSWASSPDPPTAWDYSASAGFDFPWSVTVGATTYVGTAGSQGAARDHSDTGTDNITYSFGASHDNVSIGFFIKTDLGVADFGNYDLVLIGDGGGQDFVVYQAKGNGDDQQFRIHTQAGGGSLVTYPRNTWLYVMLDWRRNTTCTATVYNAETWTLLGSSTLPVGNFNAELVEFGSTDHGLDPASTTYFDNVMIRYSNDSIEPTTEGGSITAGTVTFTTLNVGTP